MLAAAVGDGPSLEDVRRHYRHRSRCPRGEDAWHRRAWARRRNHVRRAARRLTPCRRLLNLGSGGETFDLEPARQIHLDLSETSLAGLPAAVVGNAERLPFRASSFDACLAIGSVLNYCQAPVLVAELSRVLAPRSWMLLEFESSQTLELWGDERFGGATVPLETFHGGERHRIWLHAPAYVSSLLDTWGFRVVEQTPYHVLSPLALRLGVPPALAARLAALDPVLAPTRLGHYACNVSFLCRKDRSDPGTASRTGAEGSSKKRTSPGDAPPRTVRRDRTE